MLRETFGSLLHVYLNPIVFICIAQKIGLFAHSRSVGFALVDTMLEIHLGGQCDACTQKEHAC